MPTRLHLAAADREWTLEVDEPTVRIVGHGRTVSVSREADGRLSAELGTSRVNGVAIRRGDEVWVTIDGRVFVFTVGRLSGRLRTVERDALAVPMPATVVRVAVTPGQPVRHGDLLVALEAMKMELAIRAPRDGVVTAVHCHEGDLVPAGKALVDLFDL